MNKTVLLIVFTAALMLSVAGCGSTDEPAAAPSASYTESAPPVAASDAPVTVVDFRKDVTDVHAVAADKDKFPEGNTAVVSMTITNHSANAATYEIVLGVYDESKAQVGSILVSTEASNLGPTKAGAVLKIHGPYGMDQGTLPNPFAVEVQSVDRIPA